jgi:hypothetical protein
MDKVRENNFIDYTAPSSEISKFRLCQHGSSVAIIKHKLFYAAAILFSPVSDKTDPNKFLKIIRVFSSEKFWLRHSKLSLFLHFNIHPLKSHLTSSVQLIRRSTESAAEKRR